MKIEKIILRKMKIKFKKPFQISSTKMTDKHFIFVEVHSKDHVGLWGLLSTQPSVL